MTDPDAQAVELGVKFQADIAGLVTALRFYKGTTQNAGPHVGHLWSATGQRLAEVTFTNETTSGWQQVGVNPPVAIMANTPYVASYHAPRGKYSANTNYFTAPRTAAPLRTPVNAGVYRYGPAGSFPTQVWQAANYWVDVVFVPNAPPPSPALVVSPTSLAFSAPEGGAVARPQALNVNNAGGGTLTWTASDNVPWLSLAPASGTAPSAVSVTASPAGLAAGTHTATITVTSSGALGVSATYSLASGLPVSRPRDGKSRCRI